jgi:hypothetical protein
VNDRLDRTTRVNQITSYIEPLASVSFEELKAVPANIPDRGPIRIWQRGTYEQVIEFFGDAPKDEPDSRGVNIVAPGQSGFISVTRVPDPHYADQWALYQSFDYKPMVFAQQRNTPPTCKLVETGMNPNRYLRMEVGDAEGVYTIAVDRLTRAQAQIPEGNGVTYDVGDVVTINEAGTTIVRAEALSDRKATFVMTVTDALGASVSCDPVMTTLDAEQPAAFVLEQNYPNPFNPTTAIRFQMPEAGPVHLAVYDVLGREVVRLVDGVQEAGVHEVTWTGRNSAGAMVPSGIYVYRLEAGDFSASRSMLLLK